MVYEQLNFEIQCLTYISSILSVGRISDRFGRKSVLLLSIMGTFVSYTLLYVSESEAVFFLSRILVGLLKNTETSCYSIIADISTVETRVKRMAYIGSTIGLGFIVGPALSGLLTSRYSLEYPAYVSSAILIITAIIALFLLPETRPTKTSSTITAIRAPATPTKRTESDKTSSLTLSLDSLNDELIDELGFDPVEIESDLMDAQLSTPKSPSPSKSTTVQDSSSTSPRQQATPSIFKLMLYPNPLQKLIWIYFCTTMSVMIFQGSNVLLFQLLGISVQTTSWIISYSGLLAVISSFWIRWLISSKHSEQQMVESSMATLGMTLIGTGLVLGIEMKEWQVMGMLVAYIPLILGSRALKTTLLGIVTHLTPASLTGTSIGLMNSIESLCRALAPLIGGTLMELSLSAPAFLGGAIALACLAWVRFNPLSYSSKSSMDHP
jgi:MFS family permease